MSRTPLGDFETPICELYSLIRATTEVAHELPNIRALVNASEEEQARASDRLGMTLTLLNIVEDKVSDLHTLFFKGTH